MIDTKKIAEKIVEITNDCDNDYDAVELVATYLDEQLDDKLIIKTSEDECTEERK